MIKYFNVYQKGLMAINKIVMMHIWIKMLCTDEWEWYAHMN